MADDSENTEPPPVAVSPYAFLRRPTVIFALLFLAWIFLGQGVYRLMPHHAPEAANVAPTTPDIQPAIKEPEKDAQIADLQRRLAEVEARIKTLETAAKPADDAATTAKIAALQAGLDALTQAHSTQAGDTAGITETLHKQEEDIAALKTQLADTQTRALRRLSLIAAFNTLKDAAMRGESFAELLGRMNDLAKDNAPVGQLLAQLTPYAVDGAATPAMLQSQFEAAIPQALAPGDSSLSRHLQSMIRIRKIGEQQTGNSDEAIIARAEAKLNRGDVKAGADEVAALSPPAAAAFAAWSKKAQAYLHVRDTLDALQPALLKDGE